MRTQKMEEMVKLLASEHLEAMKMLTDKIVRRKNNKNDVVVMHAMLLNAAPLMAACLLDILDEIEQDNIPVKDRSSTYLKISEVLEKAGIYQR